MAVSIVSRQGSRSLKSTHNRKLVLAVIAVLGAASSQALAQTASGTWTNAAGGNWEDPLNWNIGGGVYAGGSGNTASFTGLDLLADATVTLTASETIGSLNFSDTDTSTAGGWTIAGSTLTLAGGSTINVDALGTGKTATISSILAGSAGFTKTGAGTLTLSGTNTISGQIFVTGGTLAFANTNATSPLSGGNTSPYYTISNGATVTVGPGGNDNVGIVEFAGDGTFAHTLSSGGSQSLTVVTFRGGSGNVTLNCNPRTLLGGSTGTAGTNTGSGTVTANIGASATANLTDSRWQMEGNWNGFTGTFKFNGTSATSSVFLHQNAGSFVGTGLQNAIVDVSAAGANFMSLQGRFTSGGSISFGALTGNAGGQIRPTTGGGSGTFSIGNKGVDADYGGSILDNAALLTSIAKVGAGVQTFSSTTGLTYTGTTTVGGGELRINGVKSGTGSVSVNSGALGGSGSVAGTVTVTGGGKLSPGSGGVGAITFGNTLTLATGAQVNVEFNTSLATPNDQVLANVLNLNGPVINLYDVGTTNVFSTVGTYTLMTYTTLNGTPTLSVAPGSQAPGKSYGFVTTGGQIQLVISAAAGPVYWNVDSDGSWVTGSNWVGNTAPNAIAAYAGLGGGGTEITANRTISLNGAVTVGTVAFNNPTSSYTVAAGSGGSLTFNNDLAPGAITATTGSHSITAPIITTSQGVVATSVVAGTTLTISGGVSGTGGFSASGDGTILLSGAGLNTYSGQTAIFGTSTLRLVGADNVLPTSTALSASGTLDLNGHSHAVGSLAGAGTITNSAAADSILTVNSGGSFTGSIVDGATNKTGLTVNGATVLSIGPAAKTYSGGTTINTGATLDLGSNSVGTAAGTAAITMNNGSLRTNGAFTVSETITALPGTSNTLIANGSGTGTYSSTMNGSGTLVLNSNSAAKTVDLTGNLTAQTGTISLPTTGQGINVRFSTATTLGASTPFDLGTVAGNALGNSNQGVGSYQLGSLTGGTGTALKAFQGGTGSVTATSTYIIGGLNTSTTFNGVVRNGDPTTGVANERPTAINKVGTGTLTFAGDTDTYTGATTVNAGTLIIANTYEPTRIAALPSPIVGVTSSTRLTVASGAQFQIASTGSAKFLTADSPDSNLLVDGTLSIIGNSTFDTSTVKTFTGTGSVNVLGGTTTINESSTTLTGLTVATDGVVVPLAALKVKSLTASTGRVDMSGPTNAPLIVDYSGSTVLPTIQSYVVVGRGSVNQFGTYDYFTASGISSPVLAAANQLVGFNKFAIAAIDNLDVDTYNALASGLSYSTFGGVSVDGDSVLVRYTYSGDANLDGVIDSRDYALINAGFAGTIPVSAGWLAGDFTLDGVINADDYAVIDFGYLNGGNVPLSFGDPITVPEPTSLALLGLGAAALMGRRRRQA